MRVKNHQEVTAWNFVMITPDGTEQVVPQIGTSNLPTLLRIVISLISAYDGATDGEYSKEQRLLAEEEGTEFETYISKVIEHQLCLRMSGRIPCWNDGYGDKLHSKLSAVDGYIENTPALIRNALTFAVSKITPSKSRSFGGCSSCGGTFAFNPSVDNLGRAGQMNKLGGAEG